jgi:hypothetical protein
MCIEEADLGLAFERYRLNHPFSIIFFVALHIKLSSICDVAFQLLILLIAVRVGF